MNITIRAFILLACVVLLAQPDVTPGQSSEHLRAQGSLQGNRASLGGLQGVGVIVAVSDDSENAGYTESMARTDVELRLRQTGIRIFDQDDPNLEAQFVLAIDASIRNDFPDLVSFLISPAIMQPVALVRDRSNVVFARTWEPQSSFGFGSLRGRRAFSDDMRSLVQSMTDEFANAFLAAQE